MMVIGGVKGKGNVFAYPGVSTRRVALYRFRERFVLSGLGWRKAALEKGSSARSTWLDGAFAHIETGAGHKGWLYCHLHAYM